ncbi:MAG: hypothetical protein RLZZ164_616 [Actinomycetota bacterium]|jgi:hypothetical protein
MNFSLASGWGLLAVVALWLLVMVPGWGRSDSRAERVSTKGRELKNNSSNSAIRVPVGVSQKKNSDQKLRTLRAISGVLTFVSIAVVVHGVISITTNSTWFIEVAIALAALSFFVSVLRNTRQETPQKRRVSTRQKQDDLARMSYFIRESALDDLATEELFDERAWSGSRLPESSLNRRRGSIDLSQLADVVSLDEARDASDASKIDSLQLDVILERRRSSN